MTRKREEERREKKQKCQGRSGKEGETILRNRKREKRY